jgi:hypothetical protein
MTAAVITISIIGFVAVAITVTDATPITETAVSGVDYQEL